MHVSLKAQCAVMGGKLSATLSEYASQWTMHNAKHDEVYRCIQYSAARASDLVANTQAFALPDVASGKNGSVLGPYGK